MLRVSQGDDDTFYRQKGQCAHVGVVLDLLDRVGIELARVAVEVVGAVVGALDADQVAPVEAASVDVRDPAQVALEVGRGGSRLEGDDVAALNDIASTALDAGGGGAGSTKEGRGGRGEVLEVDHLEMLVNAEQMYGRGSKR